MTLLDPTQTVAIYNKSVYNLSNLSLRDTKHNLTLGFIKAIIFVALLAHKNSSLNILKVSTGSNTIIELIFWILTSRFNDCRNEINVPRFS